MLVQVSTSPCGVTESSCASVLEHMLPVRTEEKHHNQTTTDESLMKWTVGGNLILPTRMFSLKQCHYYNVSPTRISCGELYAKVLAGKFKKIIIIRGGHQPVQKKKELTPSCLFYLDSDILAS